MKSCDLSFFDIMECEKLKTLYINSGWCRDAALYRDKEGRFIVFWQWMEAHGVGQDHASCYVKSVKDLRASLKSDVERGLVTQRKVDEVCEECREFFEK